ncbi:MAG: 3-deoxy-D-manno-octulosonic acid transferase [Sphingobacteriales bacterium]|nr:MAG: 3-deoxy-D-manno-octulosonic acid transferase [Sphingobacteriales bacterium]
MLFLYNTGVRIYFLLIWIASFFKSKAQKWIIGRENWENKIPPNFKKYKNAWFHFASLGEYEQGKPLLEKFISHFPEHKIVLTFFSPSGYEVRKNSPLAHLVLYLPLDTQANAQKFIDLINPEIVFITKYEYWYHFFTELKKRTIPLYMVSAIFRPQQSFFRFYGDLHRKILKCVTHFFVQNQASLSLLKTINIYNATCVGDTRFDTVSNTLNHVKFFPIIKDFITDKPILVAGSTWYKDEVLLAQLLKNHPDWKLIIAPHEIGHSRINEIENRFLNCVKYTSIAASPLPYKALKNHQTLIIDTIGMLSMLYQYGHIAYIGGGFGAGIHNTLEAAAFGLPVIFGPKYQKFAEAKDLIKIKAAFSVVKQADLNDTFAKLSSDNQFCTQAGAKARVYIQRHIGASQKIIDFVLLHPFYK